MSNDLFVYENPRDSDNTLHVRVCECDDIVLKVAEEKAVDSYNSTFECSVYLPRADAERLRDALTQALARPATAPVSVRKKHHEYGWHW